METQRHGQGRPVPRNVSVQARGVVALPRELRMHLEAPGAQIELIEREDGVIGMLPQMAVPVSQLLFWDEQWQAREREAEEDISRDRMTRFDDAESFLDALPDE